MASDDELAASMLRMYGTGARDKAAEYARLNGNDGDLVSQDLWLRVVALLPEIVRRKPL